MSTTISAEKISARTNADAPREIFILNLHGIGTPRKELPASEHNVWITEAQFEMLLDQVKDRGDVELTFDDSNESDWTCALPALRSRGLKAQFFVVVGRIGHPGYLSRNQLSQLLGAGMKIGSHGLKHRPWAGLNERELNDELAEAKRRLEQTIGAAVNQAACPFGSYNRRVLQALRDAGFKRVFTSDGGPADPRSFLAPRNTIQAGDDVQMIKARLLRRPGGVQRAWRDLKLLLKRCK